MRSALGLGWYSDAKVSSEDVTRVAAVLVIKALENFEKQYVELLEKNANFEDFISQVKNKMKGAVLETHWERQIKGMESCQ